MGEAVKARKFALIAGVEKYQPNSRISDLKYAVRDAVDLGRTLKEVCGFDHVCVFAGEEVEGSKGAATQNNILDELEDWANIIAPEDLFLFAFIGHGMELDGRSYLLPADARLGRPNTYLELHDLSRHFDTIAARERVVLLDCCRNSPEAGRGDAANVMGDAFSRDIRSALEAEREQQVVSAWLTACDKGERAYEWDRVKHGVFTWYLLKGMQEEAWRGDRLTVNDLGEYVQENLKRWGGGRLRQTPQFLQTGGAKIISLAERRRRVAAGKPTPIDDPSKVEVKEFRLAPLSIELETLEVGQRPAPADNLPPVPEDIRKLQGEILGLERAIEQIAKGTHPSLADARAKIEAAKKQYADLKIDCDAAWNAFGAKCPEELETIFFDDPQADVFAQEKYCPQGAGYTDCIDLIYRARNVGRARRVVHDIKKAFDEHRAAKQKELETQLEQGRDRLEKRIKEFLEETIADFLKNKGALEKNAEFPVEDFIPFVRALQGYGFGVSDKEIWKLARNTHKDSQKNKKKIEPKERRKSFVGIFIIAFPVVLPIILSSIVIIMHSDNRMIKNFISNNIKSFISNFNYFGMSSKDTESYENRSSSVVMIRAHKKSYKNIRKTCASMKIKERNVNVKAGRGYEIVPCCLRKDDVPINTTRDTCRKLVGYIVYD